MSESDGSMYGMPHAEEIVKAERRKDQTVNKILFFVAGIFIGFIIGFLAAYR